MDLSEWDACPEKERLLKYRDIAIREYAERAFALLRDASRDDRMYRQLWNEATAAQKAAREAGVAYAKHIGEHGC